MSKVAINEKLIGYDTNGKKLITAHFICDSQSDLPVQTEYDDYILYLGCTAHCIAEHTDHELKSGGVWVKTLQIPADYDLLLNRPQINGHILTGNKTGNDLGLQNTLSFDSTPTQDSANPVTSGGIWTDQRRQDALQAEDRAALVELVDGGAKNLLKLGFTTKTVGNQTAEMTSDGKGIIVNGDRNSSSDIILVYDLSTNESSMSDTRYTLPTGRFVITPTGTDKLRVQVYCHDGGGVNSERLGQASTDAVSFEYTSALKTQYPYISYRLWASRVSSFDNFTIYPMICSKAEWDISNTYQPYRPSWQEMYDMILALQ